MIAKCRYLLSVIDQKDRRTLGIYSLLCFIAPVFDLLGFSVILTVIRSVLENGRAEKKYVVLSIVMAAVSLLRIFFEILCKKISNVFVYESSQKLSVKVYDLIMKEDLGAHNDRDVSHALTAVREDASASLGILTGAISLVIHAVSLIGYCVLLILSSGAIGAATSLVVVLYMLVSGLYFKKRMAAFGEKRRELAIRSNGQITTAYGVFREMKIDNRSEKMTRRFSDTSKRYADVMSEYRLYSGMIGIVLSNAVMAALFVFLAGLMVFSLNPISILSSMVVYVSMLMKMLPMANGIVNTVNSASYASKSYDSLSENLERYDRYKAREAERSLLREHAIRFEKGLVIKDLSFAYPGGEPIFENASAEIPVGKAVAVIGVSGAGKTTLLDLLLGLLKADGGHIYYDDFDIVDGADAEGPCRADLGSIVSYIPQQIWLNGETVRNNVAFFADEEEIDDDKVRACLDCVKVLSDVDKMPGGIYTVLGPNGSRVSGGQRQRIALARALYKDFELLVMDEATAALDMETEKAVIDSIRQVKNGKTLLMVTHHMSLANECDVIYKIEDRKLIRVK